MACQIEAVPPRPLGAAGRRNSRRHLRGDAVQRLLMFTALFIASAASGVLFAHAQPPPRLPAPTEDRVGYPAGYSTDYSLFYVFDRVDNRQVRVVYGNQAAASATAGQPFPYGSILVMETHRALLDETDNPVLDEVGRFVRGDQAGLFVMRKEPGFGAAYEHNRTGEWEYAQFALDGTLMPPQNTGSCAACHADAGGTRDWTWRTGLYFYSQSGAPPLAPPGLERTGRAYMQAYLFLPESNTVTTGTTVVWSNDDAAVHTVTAAGGNFDSGRLPPGSTFEYVFIEPGTYEYFCSLHPRTMAGRIVVN